MTRTERSLSLRALAKDRSEARNGMDSSLPKGGAGAHNWGSLEAEYSHETAAILDEDAEFDGQAGKRFSCSVTYSLGLNAMATPPLLFLRSV